jgi:adenylate kinase family enzyme
VAQESVIEISVPTKKNVSVGEVIIEKPVVIERIIEKPRAVTKVIEVDVPREIERANYVENIIKKEVHYDQVIEEKYEVLVPNVVEVKVQKEILVP